MTSKPRLFVTLMFESAIVCLSLIFTYDLLAQKAESAVNELKVLSQQDNCDPTSRCIIVGENSILVGTSSVDGNIDQILRQENKCIDNSTCNHFGEEPFIPGNKVSIGISSSGGFSTVSDLSINSEQKLNQINICTNMRGIIIHDEFGTLNFGCETSSRNLIEIGESAFPGSVTSITNVNATIKQGIDESQECTNGSEFGICFVAGTNDIVFGSSGFGGISNIANVDLKSSQKISTHLNCSDLDDLDLFCIGNAGNSIFFGNSFGESTSDSSNIRTTSDQEINQLVNCETMLGDCQTNAENGIGIGTVHNGDMVIEQKSDQELKCSDKNLTTCDQSAETAVSIGGPSAISTVSNIGLSLDQKQHQEMDCAEGSEFGVCSNVWGLSK